MPAKRNLNWCAIAVCWSTVFAIQHVPAEDPEAELVAREDILDAWRIRQDRIRSYRVEWTQTRTDQAGSLPAWDAPPPFPPRDATYTNRYALLIDGKRWMVRTDGRTWFTGDSQLHPLQRKTAFDGVVQRNFSGAIRPDFFPQLTIADTESNTELTLLDRAPVQWFYRPLSPGMGGLDPEELELLNQTATLEGRSLVVLQRTTRGGIVWEYWVDPDQDFVIRRATSKDRRGFDRRLNISYERNAQHGWVPIAWDFRRTHGDRVETRMRCTVTRWQINPDLPDEEFRIDVPEGTVVRDRRGEKKSSDEESGAALKDYGSIEGQNVLEGPIPRPKVLVRAGGACGAEDLLDDSLIVDPESKGIANVFVYLKRAEHVHPEFGIPPERPIDFRVKNGTPQPRTLVLRVGQPLLAQSDDSSGIHTHPIQNPLTAVLVSPKEWKEGARLEFRRPEIMPMKVSCGAHAGRVAYWLVLDHPYAAITDEEGMFRIEKLPIGEHLLTVWHERVGYVHREYRIVVHPEQTTTLQPMKIPVERF